MSVAPATGGRTRASLRRGAGAAQTPLVLGGLVALVLLQDRIVDLLDGRAVQAWSTMFVAIVVQALPFLVGGVLLAGLISAVLSERILARVVPQRTATAVPVAGLAGVALPGCECGAVPITSSLIGRGVAPAVALTFLLAAPAVNPIVLVSTAVAFPGQPAMVGARFVASMAVAVGIGWLWAWRGGRVPMRRRDRAYAPGSTTWNKYTDDVRHDLLHTAGFLVLGAMIAATVNVLVPRSLVDSVAGSLLVSVLVMAVLAFIVALCSEADAFIAASLSALPPTAQLTFMVVGPAVDVKLATLQAGTFGTPFALRFAPLTFAVAIASSLVVGWWLL